MSAYEQAEAREARRQRLSYRFMRLVKALGVTQETMQRHAQAIAQAEWEQREADRIGPPDFMEHQRERARNYESKLGGYEPGTYNRGINYCDIGYR